VRVQREQAASNAEIVEQEGGERRRGEESQGRNFGFVKVAVVDGKSLEHLQRCSVCKPPQLCLTFKFSFLFPFSNPTHKTKAGTANRWETSTVNSTILVVSDFNSRDDDNNWNWFQI
jgi:hypothetical protein